MAYNNMQNNAKDRDDSVNTRSINFYNKDGFDPSTLSLGFWNETFLTLRIAPTLDQNKQTQTRIYDYDKQVSTAMSIQTIMILVHSIRKFIIPAIEAGENKSVGVQVGGDSLIVVGTGVKETGAVKPYVAIHAGLNPDTKKSETSIYYEFNKGKSINDYNSETGSYELVSDINHEFMIFVEILEHAIKALSKADVHAMRTVMRAYNNKLMNSVIAIGNAVHADLPASKSYSNRNNVDFSNNSNSEYSSEESYSNLADINEMLG